MIDAVTPAGYAGATVFPARDESRKHRVSGAIPSGLSPLEGMFQCSLQCFNGAIERDVRTFGARAFARLARGIVFSKGI